MSFLNVAGMAMLAVLVTGGDRIIAQDADRFVISAKAGGINSASGDVKIRRRGAERADAPAERDALADGDRVATGAGGRVEMLLSPGAYFRAAENSEFELENSSLDNLRIKLNRGSAIIEATGASGASSFVEVRTPQTTVAVIKRGIYRINLLPSNETAVFVREGHAVVENIKVDEGRTLTVGPNGASETAVSKFNEEERDAFDFWSEARAETLAAANKRLTREALRNSYAAYRRGGYDYGIRGYRGSGLWLYDPFFGGHTFLPFYSGLSSPYGHGYRHGFGFSSHGFGSVFSTHGGRRVVSAPPRHNTTNTTTHQRSSGHISSGHHRRGH